MNVFSRWHQMLNECEKGNQNILQISRQEITGNWQREKSGENTFNYQLVITQYADELPLSGNGG